MNNLFKDFPGQEEILEWYGKNGSNLVHDVNGHFHTPYSFSSFNDLSEVFKLAEREHIKALGINDFYTTAGYPEFTELCRKYKKFPLYNIEFMGLLKPQQELGIRINDPNNPGRIYFSGKGLDFPVIEESNARSVIQNLCNESLKQTKEMTEKTSQHLSKIYPAISLDYDEILKKYTKGMLRERHIAKAVRIKIFEQFPSEAEKRIALKNIFNGKESQADLSDFAQVEDEIRSRLLKSGGPGFVKEDPKAFMDLSDVLKTIIEAGGIPTYPVLLDDKHGKFTDFEKNMESLYQDLTSRNIYSLELIPGRNDFGILKEFSTFFHDRKFILTYGTEHNTPEMIPLKVSARGGRALDEELKLISFEGTCVIAAHQYLRAKNQSGYINEEGTPRISELSRFIELGNAVIEYFLQN